MRDRKSSDGGRKRVDHPGLPPQWMTGLCFLLLLASPIWVKADFFVAADGNDANAGTREKPFATLEAARNAIRALKSQGPLPEGGLTVWLRSGDYLRNQEFSLTQIDSGTAQSPITYRAWKDETVRLLGGRPIRSWSEVSDPAVRERLPVPARAHVLQADLRAAGITNRGQFRSRGFGRAIVPAHLELFYEGQPMTVARWPNEGEWAKIAGIPTDSGQNDGHGGQIGKVELGFLYSGDRPTRWKHSDDIWVHGYWSWDWANSYERVVSIDLEPRHIKTAPPYGLYGFRPGQRFYFLNVLEELDQPGEWYLDRPQGILYCWPPNERDKAAHAPQSDAPRSLANRNAWVSILDRPLISMKDVSHVSFRGLALEGTRAHAIEIQGGESNRVAACALRNIGNYGAWIDGGHGHQVIACDIENTGDGGVNLNGGDRQTLSAGGHSVENCHFQKQGRWSKCYVPAVLVGGVGQRVAHNLIHDHPHCAILFNGNEHLIEFNEIHHIALETGDVGAIYTGRDWTYRGNRIRHNYIHHTGGVGMGSMGVYMDDCISGTEIYGNIFYKVQRAAFLGGGRDHRVENNVFVECQPAVALDGRGLDKSPVWHSMVYQTMKQRLSEVPQELYRQRYPTIAEVDVYYAGDKGVPPEQNVVVRNICQGGQWLSVGWHAQADMIELHDNHVSKPFNAEVTTMEDLLPPQTSEVWPAGFQPIPTGSIGLQNDPWRRELRPQPQWR